MDAAQQWMDGKAKPPGSLGSLESWAIRLSSLQGTLKPRIRGACLLLFAGDHGITKDVPEVSAYPREVTPSMFEAIAAGLAASSVLCRSNSCHLELVDVGVDADVSHVAPVTSHTSSCSGISVAHCKVAAGSASFRVGPALTQQQCDAAMAVGAAAVARACARAGASMGDNARGGDDGCVDGTDGDCTRPAASGGGRAVGGDGRAVCTADGKSEGHANGGKDPALDGGGSGDSWPCSQLALCVGELGIGNTTSAAALLAALLGLSPQEACGRGTGVTNKGLAIKQQVVGDALAANAAAIVDGPLGVLRSLGGLELAAMVGAYLEAGRLGVPVLVDGFISGAAALVAVRLEPQLRGCLFATHRSAEAGAPALLAALGCGPPPLDMGLRLGEGSGALLCLPLLRSAAAVMAEMASLDDVLQAAAARAGSGGGAGSGANPAPPENADGGTTQQGQHSDSVLTS